MKYEKYIACFIYSSTATTGKVWLHFSIEEKVPTYGQNSITVHLQLVIEIRTKLCNAFVRWVALWASARGKWRAKACLWSQLSPSDSIRAREGQDFHHGHSYCKDLAAKARHLAFT